MASYLFPALLLLFSVVFCAFCGAASADPANVTVELSAELSLDVLNPRGDGKEDLNLVRAFSPFLFSIGDLTVAFIRSSRRNYRKSILAKYIGKQGDKWGDWTIEDDRKNWRAQEPLSKDIFGQFSFTSVARDNSIYLLLAAVSLDVLSSSQQTTDTGKLYFFLSVGTFTGGGNVAKDKIVWDTPVPLDPFVTDAPQNFQGVSLFDGSAFLTDDGTFVFVVRAFNFTNSNSAFVIVRSKDLKDDFKFSYVTAAAGCYPSFFSWNNKLFLVPRYCTGNDDNLYKLQESNDMGETWGEATAPLAKRLDTREKGRAFFTRITIEGERVLLFTHEVPATVGSSTEKNVSLMIADEEHYEDLGLIATDVWIAASGSFSYMDDELFFLTMRDNDAGRIIFIRLKEQLGKIKQLLGNWSAEKRAEGTQDYSAGGVPSPEVTQVDSAGGVPSPEEAQVDSAGGVPSPQGAQDHSPGGVSSPQGAQDYSAGGVSSPQETQDDSAGGVSSPEVTRDDSAGGVSSPEVTRDDSAGGVSSPEVTQDPAAVVARDGTPDVEAARVARVLADTAKQKGESALNKYKEFENHVTTVAGELANAISVFDICNRVADRFVLQGQVPSKEEIKEDIGKLRRETTEAKNAVEALKAPDGDSLSNQDKEAELTNIMADVESKMTEAKQAVAAVTDDISTIVAAFEKAGALQKAAEKASVSWTGAEGKLEEQLGNAAAAIAAPSRIITEIKNAIEKFKNNTFSETKTLNDKLLFIIVHTLRPLGGKADNLKTALQTAKDAAGEAKNVNTALVAAAEGLKGKADERKQNVLFQHRPQQIQLRIY